MAIVRKTADDWDELNAEQKTAATGVSLLSDFFELNNFDALDSANICMTYLYNLMRINDVDEKLLEKHFTGLMDAAKLRSKQWAKEKQAQLAGERSEGRNATSEASGKRTWADTSNGKKKKG